MIENRGFDLTGDGLVDLQDIDYWVEELKYTWIGDADLDGECQTADLIQAFASGKYETDLPAAWEEGDWDGNLRFNSGDLIRTMDGPGNCFVPSGPREALVVPEFSGFGLLISGLLVGGLSDRTFLRHVRNVDWRNAARAGQKKAAKSLMSKDIRPERAKGLEPSTSSLGSSRSAN